MQTGGPGWTPRFVRDAAQVRQALTPPTEPSLADEALLKADRERYLHDAALRPAVKKLWTFTGWVAAVVFFFWISGIVQREQERRADSATLGILRRYAESDPLLKRAIEKAQHEYQDYQESLNDDPE